jgi:hypothetical protein
MSAIDVVLLIGLAKSKTEARFAITCNATFPLSINGETVKVTASTLTEYPPIVLFLHREIIIYSSMAKKKDSYSKLNNSHNKYAKWQSF